MKKKILSLLVLLAAAVTGAWADDDVLNLVVDGTSATIMYDGNANNNPHLTTGYGWSQSGQDWDAETTIRSTITTVTIDGSCNNFNGTLLNSMFANFSGLTTIKGLKNLNTVGVQFMESMFRGCSSLTSIDLSNFNTASVTSMFGMFTGCSSLTTLDLSSFNTEKVKKMNLMFKGCSSLETIYVGDGWSTAAVTHGDNMFDGCTKLLSMNTANPATDMTNAHTGEGGYLKVKPFDYLFTVADCDHGSGKVSFTVGEGDAKVENAKGAYIADEGKTVTMTITPDEGWVVDVANVKAQAYTTWANAGARRRRSAPANIQILGDIEFNDGTAVDPETGVATFTFTMPAANVVLKVGYLATSNLYLSNEALTDKANIAVTAGETTVEFDDDGKSTTTVTEGTTVTTKYNGSKKIIGVKAVKKAGNTYQKWDANQKELVATDIPAEVTTVQNANQNVFWEAGTYVVEGNVTINGTIILNGNVELIIKNGAKLTVNDQIAGNSKNLSIYGQANQTGQLVVNFSDGDAITSITTLEVHSCQVTATSSESGCSGFHDIQTFNVYGGSVDAENTGTSGYGIYFDSNGLMNIYGGDVKAVGKGESYGITGLGAPVTVYGGKLWAECAGYKALYAVELQKGEGFTGKIETSDNGSSWTEYTEDGTPGTKYVRVGY